MKRTLIAICMVLALGAAGCEPAKNPLGPPKNVKMTPEQREKLGADPDTEIDADSYAPGAGRVCTKASIEKDGPCLTKLAPAEDNDGDGEIDEEVLGNEDADCQEDEACWNCEEMGNQICGKP